MLRIIERILGEVKENLENLLRKNNMKHTDACDIYWAVPVPLPSFLTRKNPAATDEAYLFQKELWNPSVRGRGPRGKLLVNAARGKRRTPDRRHKIQYRAIPQHSQCRARHLHLRYPVPSRAHPGRCRIGYRRCGGVRSGNGQSGPRRSACGYGAGVHPRKGCPNCGKRSPY